MFWSLRTLILSVIFFLLVFFAVIGVFSFLEDVGIIPNPTCWSETSIPTSEERGFSI